MLRQAIANGADPRLLLARIDAALGTADPRDDGEVAVSRPPVLTVVPDTAGGATAAAIASVSRPLRVVASASGPCKERVPLGALEA